MGSSQITTAPRLVLQRIAMTGQLGADDLLDKPDLGAPIVGVGEEADKSPSRMNRSGVHP